MQKYMVLEEMEETVHKEQQLMVLVVEMVLVD